MINLASLSTDESTGRPVRHFSLTLESALWILVAAVALGLRLARLDAAPLNGDEAHEAMLAWRAVNGLGMPQANYSPALLAANALLFFLGGGSDVQARLYPALLGATLAFAPFLLRGRIGRVGALAAGLYLALSPTALLASRQLDGAVVAAVGGMACLSGVLQFWDTGRRSWLTLAAGGLALALVSSSSAYGLLLAMGLSWLLTSWAWSDGGVRRLGELLRPHLIHLLAVFLLSGLALATGLGWNPAGLGAAGDLLRSWLARFGPAPNPAPSPLLLLAVYEPLALLFGVVGLVWTVRRGRRFHTLLGVWAGLGALLLALMPGRAPLDVMWVLLPLALLGGAAVQWLAQGLQGRGRWLSEGLYVPVVVILWIHFYLMLGRYVIYATPAHLALAFLTLALQVLLAMVFALALHIDTALRGVAVGTGVALLAVTLSAGWGSAHVRSADPRELLVREPAAIEVRDLVQTLRDLSWRRTGVPTTLEFTLEAAPDSVLAWYLRDFSAARRVEHIDADELGPVLVTARRDLALADVLEGVAYVGQDFPLRRRWDPAEVACTWGRPPRCENLLKWLLFRDTPAYPAPDQSAALWLREEEGELVVSTLYSISHSH